MEKKLKVAAIIQARVNSSRMPGKVLEKIKDKNLLEIIYLRLKKSKKIQDIKFVIPKHASEKKLKNHLKNNKIPFFEGSEKDVLDRYYQCAKKYNYDHIIRVTGDCPLVDSSLIDEMYMIFKEKKLDFISNYSPPTFPDGLDISIFTFDTLKKAWTNSESKFDREHVVPYILNNKNFKQENFKNNLDLSLERWTVDEPEDLIVIKNIFKRFKNKYNFSWKEVLKLKSKYKDDFKANMDITRDEGALMNAGQKLWKRAKKVIPGGNMLLSKRPDYFLPNKWPTYFKKTKDCNIWDLDGNKFIDMSIMGVGTNTLGYNHTGVDNAVKESLKLGNLSTFNAPEEVYLAEKLITMHDWADMVKFTRSGGEANAVAIRIARSSTTKEKVAICGYHGWHDWYLATNLLKDDRLNSHLIEGLSPVGVPKGLSGTVFSFKYNDFKELEKLIKKHNIGIIKMEVVRNFQPKNNFLQKVRDICNRKNIILIFDECTTGFRQTFGGIHKHYGVNPDMAIFGKALGNGYAINAILGKEKIMRNAEKTFISSTFWSEKIGYVAALKTLEEMEKMKSWKIITDKGYQIRKKWARLANKYNLKIEFMGIPAISSFFIKSKNFVKYKTLITQELLKDSILASNVIYFSTKHSQTMIDKYMISLERVFKIIAECENGRNIDQLLETKISQNFFQRLN